MILGLQRGAVRLVPHQKGWIQVFAEETRRLEIALSTSVLGIEHVGSTAVPRLQAKPVIDIAASVRCLADILTDRTVYTSTKDGFIRRILQES